MSPDLHSSVIEVHWSLLRLLFHMLTALDWALQWAGVKGILTAALGKTCLLSFRLQKTVLLWCYCLQLAVDLGSTWDSNQCKIRVALKCTSLAYIPCLYAHLFLFLRVSVMVIFKGLIPIGKCHFLEKAWCLLWYNYDWLNWITIV